MIKKSVLISVGLCFMLAMRLESTTPDIPYPIELRLEPSPMPSVAGPVNLKVSIISNETCEGATLAVTEIDNLEYAGDIHWNLSFNQSDTTALNLKLIIPENDTSGIGLTCSCSVYGKLRWEAYFISDSSKVTFHNANPRRVSRTPKGVPIDMSDPPKTDEKKENQGTICYEDEDGNLVPIDSMVNGLSPTGKRVGTFDQDGNFIPLDSLLKLSSSAVTDTSRSSVIAGDRSKVWTHDAEGNQIRVDRDSLMKAVKEKKIEAEFEEMRELEKSPLTEYDNQYIKVDGFRHLLLATSER